MVHEVGHPWDRLGLDSGRFQLVDESPVDLSRRWDGEIRRVILVEHEAHMDAALDGGLKRAEDRGARTCVEAQIVDRNI